MPSETMRQRLPLNLLVVFLVLAAGIIISGDMYYVQQKEQLKRDRKMEKGTY
jgi:hypothetical protein